VFPRICCTSSSLLDVQCADQCYANSSSVTLVLLYEPRPLFLSLYAKYSKRFTCSLLLVVSSPFSPPHRPDVIRHYNSDDSCSLLSLSSGPVSFSSASGERRCSPDTNKDEEGIITTWRGGCAAIDLPICTYNIVGHQKRKRKEVEEE
jgi:hypothetical protein